MYKLRVILMTVKKVPKSKSIKTTGYQTRKAKTAEKLPPAPDNRDLDILGEAPDDSVSLDQTDMERGVSLTWLAQVFRMDKNTVKKRIAPCAPVGKRLGFDVYALRQVAGYLVQPKVDIGQWIKSLRPNDLPPYLQTMYWDAALKRQKWEENAGDLWRTDVILDTFGDLAMTMKSQIQLWVENIDRVNNITPEIRAAITGQSDILLAEIYKILIEAPNKRRSTSQLAELPAMIENNQTVDIDDDVI